MLTDEEADQLILQWTEVAEGGREAAGKHVRAAQAASEEAQQDQLAVPEADVPFVMYFGKYSKKPKGPLNIRQVMRTDSDYVAHLCLQGVFKNRPVLVRELDNERLLDEVKARA